MPPTDTPPLVSIAVPVYNTAAYLGQALDSLLAQSHGNWEGLLWDDGSSDGSGAIARAYAARDRRFRVMGDGINRGNPATLAAALSEAHGEFLGVLDSDDLLEPDALAGLLAFMQAQPSLGMAYSSCVEMDEGGRELGPSRRSGTPYSAHRLLTEFMTFQFRLMRTQAYRAAGGYDPAVDESADYDLCLRLSETCAIAHLPRPLYRYRIHSGSVSRSQRLRQVRSSFDAAVRALHRRGLADRHALQLALQVRHVLRPKTARGTGANDPEAEQCLRQSPPFDPANASPAHDWAEQLEERYRAFVADALRRGLDERYDCALEIDSWHILTPLRPFAGWRVPSGR